MRYLGDLQSADTVAIACNQWSTAVEAEMRLADHNTVVACPAHSHTLSAVSR